MPNFRLVLGITGLVCIFAPACNSAEGAKQSDVSNEHESDTKHSDAGKGASTTKHADAAVHSDSDDDDDPSTSSGSTPSGGSSSGTSGKDAGASGTTQLSGVVTYQHDIRPLLENNCVECHTTGGIGPSALDDWTQVKALGGAIVSAIMSGIMPPWPAADDCHPIQDARSLPQASKDLFMQWQTGGFQEGAEADYVPPTKKARLDLGPPTLTMKGDDSYTPAVNGDSYRCYYAGVVQNDTYVTALDIVPTVRNEVHHVILYSVAPADAPTIEQTDKSAAGGGYPCNSAGVGTTVQAQNLFSYRPGGVTVSLPQGDAVYIKAGSGLVLQAHYNTQFLPAGAKPEPDNTGVEIWAMPEGKTPDRVIYRTGILSPLNGSSDGSPAGGLAGNSIPANASNIVGETTLKMSGVSVLGSGLSFGAVTGKFLAGEVVGMTPHAHAWASKMLATLTPTGKSEQCLIKVPKWDYNWQMDYLFTDGVPYGPDDTLHVECDYDNTESHQPTINGTKRPVQTLTFGESTLNEMCEHYLWLRFKYADFKAAKL